MSEKAGKFDVIVIGSGIGGLSSAAFLAKNGYRVLVVERLPFIGGRASTLEHKGFKISTGAGAPELELEQQIYKPLGLPFNVRVPSPNNAYWINGKWHPAPEKGKLRWALEIACGKAETEKIMKALKRAITWNEPSNTISFRDWLLQYTQNEKAIGVFNASWQISEVKAGAIIREIKTIGPMPYAYTVRGHLADLMEPLASVVKNAGGDVWTLHEATRILVEDYAVKGVVVAKRKKGKLEEETEIKCKAVISNAGPYKTIELAGEKNFEKSYLKEVRETIKTFPWLAIQVSSKGPLLEYPGVGFLVGCRIANWTLSPTMLCPELAPPGKHITYVGAWIPPNPPWQLDRYLEWILEDLREISGVRYEKYFEEVLHVAYFLRQSWPMYHSYDGYSIRQKTPIENLYNVGDAVYATGHVGLLGCAVTGKVVANDLMTRIKPGEE